MLDKLPIHGTPVVILAMLLRLINHRFILLLILLLLLFKSHLKIFSICYSYRQERHRYSRV